MNEVIDSLDDTLDLGVDSSSKFDNIGFISVEWKGVKPCRPCFLQSVVWTTPLL